HPAPAPPRPRPGLPGPRRRPPRVTVPVLLLGSANQGKLRELRTILGGLPVELVGLAEAGLGGPRSPTTPAWRSTPSAAPPGSARPATPARAPATGPTWSSCWPPWPG